MDYTDILRKQMENVVDESEFSTIYDEAYNITGGISQQFTLENIFNSTLQGEPFFHNGQVIDTLKSLVIYEVRSALILSVEILSICIVIGLLKNLADGFGSKGITRLCTLICCMIIVGISLRTFQISYQLVLDTIQTMTYTMEIMLPILIGILIATGSVTSGTVLSPIMVGAVTGFSAILKNLILPAFFISVVLSLANCLTEKDYVNKLSKLIRSAAVFATGLILTVLSGVMALQGLLTETSDELLIGAVKYSMSNFIPLVGGFTSDTAELFIKCMGSIKSVVGVFGLVMVILLMSVPLLKILLVGLIYKLTASLVEPITEKKISDNLYDMGGAIFSMASILFLTSLLFVVFLSIILQIGV